jgi:hypothetical protein
MMPLIRFATAQDVFDAFPTAHDDVDADPTDVASLSYLQSLADGGAFKNAIAFCAYLLPRREAVWWGCHCIRTLATKLTPDEIELLEAAESWVEVPEEDRRLTALELGMRSNHNWPSTWLALAAGWSGGNIILGIHATAQAPPHQTAKAVRAAVLTAISRLSPLDRINGMRTCINAGVRLASDEVH